VAAFCAVAGDLPEVLMALALISTQPELAGMRLFKSCMPPVEVTAWRGRRCRDVSVTYNLAAVVDAEGDAVVPPEECRGHR